MKSFLTLFKALPIEKVGKKNPTKELLEKTIKRGFAFSPEVVFNYSEDDLNSIIIEIEKIFGLDPSKLNNTFHKSWGKIKNTPMEILVFEQMIHYITTYGFEQLGIYDENTVYIPTEKLKIPKIDIDKIPLILIKGYTKEEIKVKIFNLLSIGIALSDNTKNDVIDISTFLGINEEELSKIKNKEIRVILYDFLDLIPKNPIEFLRFVIYKVTNKTLIIKDEATISEIKSNLNIQTLKLFKKYSELYGLEHIAEIFFRFKPIFLAFRTNIEMKKIINKIRRLAKSHHKPMPEDFLNNITEHIKYNKLDIAKLKNELTKVNIFRKVRLAYALKFRTVNPENIMYKIRNGKTFIKQFEPSWNSIYQEVLDVIIQSISDDLKKKVNGKKIYIPKSITYTLPATEKQFINNFPSGTCITVPKKMVFGIHWFDVARNRIDLDLSLIDNKGMKIGWDSYYSGQDGNILFSGDMTSAPYPKGASELFYVKSNENDIFGIMFVNYFNIYDKSCIEVPFKIVVGSDNKITNLEKNYMINPNNVISVENTTINTKQKILGLLVLNKKECKFYYVNSNLAGSITSKQDPLTNKARQFLFDFYFGTITLNEVLLNAGAILVESKTECEIDLSPEALEKNTIIDLIT